MTFYYFSLFFRSWGMSRFVLPLENHLLKKEVNRLKRKLMDLEKSQDAIVLNVRRLSADTFFLDGWHRRRIHVCFGDDDPYVASTTLSDDESKFVDHLARRAYDASDHEPEVDLSTILQYVRNYATLRAVGKAFCDLDYELSVYPCHTECTEDYCSPDVWEFLALLSRNIFWFLHARFVLFYQPDNDGRFPSDFFDTEFAMLFPAWDTDTMGADYSNRRYDEFYDEDNNLVMQRRPETEVAISDRMAMLATCFDGVFTVDVGAWIDAARQSYYQPSHSWVHQVAFILRVIRDETQLILMADFITHSGENYHAFQYDRHVNGVAMRNLITFGLHTFQIRNKFIGRIAPDKYFAEGISLFEAAAVASRRKLAIVRMRTNRYLPNELRLPDDVWSIIQEHAVNMCTPPATVMNFIPPSSWD